jgi:hypothetical protein
MNDVISKHEAITAQKKLAEATNGAGFPTHFFLALSSPCVDAAPFCCVYTIQCTAL